MKEQARKTGIDIVSEVTWGAHLCQFYETKEDLSDILVPYFKAGLENNEFCMWVTSEPLNVEDAKSSLKKVVKDLDYYIEKGQIEILDYRQWYTKSGKFDAGEVLHGWVEKEQHALKEGFQGLRLTGNTLWLEREDWRNFTEYEAVVDNVIGKHRMIAICSYSLRACGASEVIDVISNHEFALIRQRGKWEVIQSAERKRVKEELGYSKQLLERTLNSIRDGVLILDAGTVGIVDCNPAASEIFGYNREEMLGRTTSFLHVDQATLEAFRRKLYAAIKEKGFPHKFEVRMKRKDGTIFPAEHSVAPLMDEKRTQVGWVSVVSDITERKQAEEALRKVRDELEVRVAERTAELVRANEHLRDEIEQRELAEETLREAHKELRHRNKEISKLSKKLLSLHECDRKQLSMELHDEIGQMLTIVKMDVERAASSAAATCPSLKEKMKRIANLLAKAIREVKDICHRLRPSALDTMGLIPSLRMLIDEASDQGELQLSFYNNGIPERFDPEMDIAIYRIVQEALTNIMKYANAKNVFINLILRDSRISLTIEDDGIGFDVDEIAKRRATTGKGLGLLIMQERVDQLRGTLFIESRSGNGTLTIVEIPYKKFVKHNIGER
jgi:PAS domain S-box-containing protein